MTNWQNRMFYGYLVGRPYSRDTRETLAKTSCHHLLWLFTFQSCARHMLHFARRLLTSYLPKLLWSSIALSLHTLSLIRNPYNEICKIEFIQLCVALFHVKFSCNFAIRYLVFKWELCKGFVWESVKKTQDVCTQKEPHDWISWLASYQRWHTCEACKGAKGSW